jgi:hypothetical protein
MKRLVLSVILISIGLTSFGQIYDLSIDKVETSIIIDVPRYLDTTSIVISVFNVLGEQVINEKITVVGRGNEIQVKTNNLRPSLYISSLSYKERAESRSSAIIWTTKTITGKFYVR